GCLGAFAPLVERRAHGPLDAARALAISFAAAPAALLRPVQPRPLQGRALRHWLGAQALRLPSGVRRALAPRQPPQLRPLRLLRRFPRAFLHVRRRSSPASRSCRPPVLRPLRPRPAAEYSR